MSSTPFANSTPPSPSNPSSPTKKSSKISSTASTLPPYTSPTSTTSNSPPWMIKNFSVSPSIKTPTPNGIPPSNIVNASASIPSACTEPIHGSTPFPNTAIASLHRKCVSVSLLARPQAPQKRPWAQQHFQQVQRVRQEARPLRPPRHLLHGGLCGRRPHPPNSPSQSHSWHSLWLVQALQLYLRQRENGIDQRSSQTSRPIHRTLPWEKACLCRRRRCQLMAMHGPEHWLARCFGASLRQRQAQVLRRSRLGRIFLPLHACHFRNLRRHGRQCQAFNQTPLSWPERPSQPAQHREHHPHQAWASLLNHARQRRPDHATGTGRHLHLPRLIPSQSSLHPYLDLHHRHPAPFLLDIGCFH